MHVRSHQSVPASRCGGALPGTFSGKTGLPRGGFWEGWGLSVEPSGGLWAMAVLALFGPWGRGRSLPVSGAELSEGGVGPTERGRSVPLSQGAAPRVPQGPEAPSSFGTGSPAGSVSPRAPPAESAWEGLPRCLGTEGAAVLWRRCWGVGAFLGAALGVFAVTALRLA